MITSTNVVLHLLTDLTTKVAPESSRSSFEKVTSTSKVISVKQVSGSTMSGTSNEETKKSYELVALENGEAGSASTENSEKRNRDMKWTGLNFTAGKTNILTDCWGTVSC